MVCGSERGILHLKRGSGGLWLYIERGMLLLKCACFGLCMIEQGIFLFQRTCFALRFIERGIYFCTALV